MIEAGYHGLAAMMVHTYMYDVPAYLCALIAVLAWRGGIYESAILTVRENREEVYIYTCLCGGILVVPCSSTHTHHTPQ